MWIACAALSAPAAIRSCHLDPLNGDVYVFSNRSRTVLKLLHWERGGYTLYYKRLSVGRFHPKIFLRDGVGFRSMRWDELVLLMEGISPGVARRKRYRAGLSREEVEKESPMPQNSRMKT